jgi:hypothetical protein
MSFISIKSILIAPIASLLAGFVIGTNFLPVYQSTDYDSNVIYSLGDAILFSTPAYTHWRFDESMKAYRLQKKLKSNAQLLRESCVYHCAVANPLRGLAELLALAAMVIWFMVTGLLFVLPLTYEVLGEEPSRLEPIMTIPLFGHALRFLKAYW